VKVGDRVGYGTPISDDIHESGVREDAMEKCDPRPARDFDQQARAIRWQAMSECLSDSGPDRRGHIISAEISARIAERRIEMVPKAIVFTGTDSRPYHWTDDGQIHDLEERSIGGGTMRQVVGQPRDPGDLGMVRKDFVDQGRSAPTDSNQEDRLGNRFRAAHGLSHDHLQAIVSRVSRELKHVPRFY